MALLANSLDEGREFEFFDQNRMQGDGSDGVDGFHPRGGVVCVRVDSDTPQAISLIEVFAA